MLKNILLSLLLAAAGLAGCQTMPAAMRRFTLTSEYGALQKVIVGLPYGKSPELNAP